MNRLPDTSDSQRASLGDPDVGERSVYVAVTCTDCRTTYEPTGEDLDAGRTGCPDPDCGGWTFWAGLLEPTAVGPTARKTG